MPFITRERGLTWIPPASIAERLKDVPVESHVHVRENEGDFPWSKLHPSGRLLNHKRNVHSGLGLSKVADLGPGYRIVKRLFHVTNSFVVSMPQVSGAKKEILHKLNYIKSGHAAIEMTKKKPAKEVTGII